MKTFGESAFKFFTNILGINPGRFGAGTTGIAFIDPIRLENECGINNSFPKKVEEFNMEYLKILTDAHEKNESV